MKTIDPMEHRLGMSVSELPGSGDPNQRLATCAHHPEWNYQGHFSELGEPIDQHIAAHADGQPDVPTVGAVPVEARREVVFSVEQGARLEAARLLSGAGGLYGKDRDFAGFLREVGQLADLITYGKLPAGAAPAVAGPTALPLDEVTPGQSEPE